MPTPPSDADVPGIARVLMTAQALDHPPPNHGVPLTRPGQIPAYTLDDVRAYFIAHPLIAGDVVPGTTVTLTRLEFITGKQLGAILQIRPSFIQGVGENGIVCYLEFTGTFSMDRFSSPVVFHHWPDPPGSPPKDPYVHQTHLVLDAATGHAINWGL